MKENTLKLFCKEAKAIFAKRGWTTFYNGIELFDFSYENEYRYHIFFYAEAVLCEPSCFHMNGKTIKVRKILDSNDILNKQGKKWLYEILKVPIETYGINMENIC